MELLWVHLLSQTGICHLKNVYELRLKQERKKWTIFDFSQASMSISIPKEHHRFILGKSGIKLKELEKTTATKISVPNVADSSDKITITGTKEGIEKAVHEIKVTSDEQVF